MILMATILGSLVLGVSAAGLDHPPRALRVGHPDGDLPGCQVRLRKPGARRGALAMLQIGTTLILILAANTSFTGFPFLASFAAEDSYLPRQLTEARPPPGVLDRNHRAHRGLRSCSCSSPRPEWTA